MNIDMITQYVATIVPSITSIGVCIGTLCIGIAKVKKAFNDADSTNRKTLKKMDQLLDAQQAILRENAELKRENAALKKKFIYKVSDQGEGAPDGNE